jgi:hypothetical protein
LGAFKDDPQALLRAAVYVKGAMKFNGQFSIPRIDVAAYRSALDQHMSDMIAQALMAWLEAVLAEIPVWSGASRATFVKLADSISYSLPITPTVMDRTWKGEAQSDGSLTANKDTGEYSFTYGTTLPWLIWNEYHNANVEPDPTLFGRLIKEGPYNFQAVGARAFLAFADKVDLLPVAPYVKAERVKT